MFRGKLAVAVVAVGAFLIAAGIVAAQEGTGPSAGRVFDTTSVAAGGGPVVATITVSGATQAVVTETLPAGFTYVSSSLPDSQVRPDPNDGQRIRFVLADSADNPFTYTVTVSQAGAISGKLTVDRVEYDVTGDDTVTVEEGTGPSAGRVFDTTSVAAGGGPVVATITVSGATQAVVTETLPAGFTYVSSSLPDSQVRPDPNDGQRIRFVLADSADNPFTYTVTVSQAGAISGKLTVDRVEYDVTGDDTVTVEEGTGPSAGRVFDTTSVAAGGGPVVATITVSGATQAVVTETLPAGFTYVSSSLPDSQVRPDPNDGQRIRFVLADSADNPFTYTVTVSQAGAISGKLTVDRVEYDVTGGDTVTVRSASSGGGGGGGGGGQSVDPTSTPTPRPTSTPTPDAHGHGRRLRPRPRRRLCPRPRSTPDAHAHADACAHGHGHAYTNTSTDAYAHGHAEACAYGDDGSDGHANDGPSAYGDDGSNSHGNVGPSAYGDDSSDGHANSRAQLLPRKKAAGCQCGRPS